MSVRYSAIIVSIAIFFALVPLGYAEQKRAPDIEDLLYKNSLYHYYSGDYISALTRTLINDAQYKDSKYNTRNKLLQGGIYLAYGLDYDAKAIFESLNSDDIEEEIRNIIWFYLGRDFYDNFDYANSEVSLERITNNISKKNNTDKINILSNVYVYNNKLDKLEKILLQESLSPEISNYIKFNLGIGYLRNNEVEKGKKYLLDVADIKPVDVEKISLSDKAKLHLANLSFKEKDYKSTIKYIDDMNSNGVFSESAIYLAALSHSIVGNTKKAFSLLSALKARESKNIYKYYSILLIARILEQNGNLETSLKVLNNGVDVIKIEKQELDGLLNKIRNDFFLTDLKKDKSGEIIVTNPQYRKLVNDLVFSRDFSGLYNHYIDLLHLKKTIQHWNNQIPEFYLMLKERDKYFREKKSLLSMPQYYEKQTKYIKKIKSLQSVVNKIESTKNIEGLFTEEESDFEDDLKYMSGKITRLEKKEDVSDYKEKVRIMRGVNYWNAASQYHSRIWDAKSTLRNTNNDLKVLNERLSSLNIAAKSEFNYSAHKKSVDVLYSRLKGMDSRLNKTVSQLKEHLIKIAASELNRRFKDIDSYYSVFRFDVARVSDRIVINKKK